MRKPMAFVLVLILLFLILLPASLYSQLGLPAPSGPFPVGRTSVLWVDQNRPEAMTSDPNDDREVAAVIWYPAERGEEPRSPYISHYDQYAPGFVDSGELSAVEVWGLRFIRASSAQHAPVSRGESSYPILFFSPGNASNAEFYSALAEDLASNGYVVVGVNHPYDVTAVALSSGAVVPYAADRWPEAVQERQAFVQNRIAVRVEDVLFALDQLGRINADQGSLFFKRLNMEQVGVLGHSLGGITAAQACLASSRFKACLNLDGLQAGGPFSASANARLPAQPFMMITKEASIHPKIMEMFQNLSARGYLVRIANGTHDSFSDGELLRPALLPLPGSAEEFTDTVRSYILVFFDQTLLGKSGALIGRPSQTQQVILDIFPATE